MAPITAEQIPVMNIETKNATIIDSAPKFDKKLSLCNRRPKAYPPNAKKAA